jgi:SAM-dependent methyltransferase
MTTDFNDLADTYAGTKASPIKRYSEEPTFLAALGDVTGLSVLDLACGNGYYTRRIKQAGARRVLGVDVAEGMVAEGREAEAREPLGVEYQVHDAGALPVLGRFDRVTAVFLFDFAPTEAALTAMISAAAANLRPGGRLVSVGMGTEIDAEVLAALPGYGISLRATLPLQDGDIVTVTIETPAGPVHINNHYWSRAAYERAFAAAGFDKVEWVPITVSAEGLAAHGADFWQAHLKRPAIAVIAAQRASAP